MGRKIDPDKLKRVRKALKKLKVSNVYRLSQETGIDSRTIQLMLAKAKELGWRVEVFPERSFTVIWKEAKPRADNGTLGVLMRAKSHSGTKMGLSSKSSAYAHRR